MRDFAALKATVATAAMTVMSGGMAMAQETPNHPQDGAIAMLPAGSALAEEVHFFHNSVLLPIITVISLFVLALLIWVIIRYNTKANPDPRKFSHNTLVEVLWTGIPILILLFIALFSFDLLYKEDVIPDGKQVIVQADGRTTDFVFPNDFAATSRRVTRPNHIQVFLDGGEKLARGDYKITGLGDDEVVVSLNTAPAAGANVLIQGGRSLVGRNGNKEIAMAPTVTLKVNGFQWGWTYSYPDFGDFEFVSNMLPEEDTTKELYRLTVDNPVYVPVGETIRVTTTARDVIHSFALPNFAIKVDAVPGRINETWFKADRVGTYYGQCSEICGVRHSFMPIEVRVVSRADFETWVDGQRELAGLEPMFQGDAQKFAQAATLNETSGE